MENHETIVDLHIHSHYSRATSKEMNIESLYRWGKMKGINVIGTGDITHPAWFAELKEKLEPVDNGLYRLKDEYAANQDKLLSPVLQKNPIFFIPTVEISNIYSRHDKTRRLHNLIILPDFDAAAKFNSHLAAIGNLKSDGRPILGLDSRNLLEITLGTDSNALFIPAHIWTPWFALFGSKSGFNTLEEAFGDLKTEIKAVETGLSSDPYMNWRLNDLQGITLVSNSDAHSPAKLGREANVLTNVDTYIDIIRAIKTGNNNFSGTIEFYPDEGKYHYDGHRACKVRTKPSETKNLKGLCPKCGKPLTLGVEYRVDELANRSEDFRPEKHKNVEYIIPLSELIAEIGESKSSVSKRVTELYLNIINSLGDEFTILRSTPIEEIKKQDTKLAVAVDKMRHGQVFIEAGYDGVFGIVKVYSSPGDMEKSNSGQLGLL